MGPNSKIRDVDMKLPGMPTLLLAGFLLGLAWPAWATDSFEPNDDPNDPLHHLGNGEATESWVSTPKDEDWFRFTQAAEGNVDIRLSSLPDDYDLELYVVDGSQLQFVEISGNFGTEDEHLDGSLTAGEYFILIYGFEKVFDAEDSYILTATFQGDGGGGNDPPAVTVNSPNGGETLAGGSLHNITYTATDPNGDNLTITLEFSTNGGTSWTVIAGNQPNNGTHSWTVPNLATTQAQVRVIANDGQATDSDTSDGNFTITTTPQGNNTLAVTNGSGGSGADISVQLTLDNDDAVRGIQTDLVFNPAVLSFQGAVASGRAVAFSDSSNVVANGRARVLLFAPTGTSLSAGSGAVAQLTFRAIGASGTSSTVTPTASVLSDPNGASLAVDETAGTISVSGGGSPPAVSLTSPNGGETLTGGATHTITYDATGGSGPLAITLEFSINGGSTFTSIAAGLSNTGTHTWSVPNTATTQGRVRVTASDGQNSATDVSANNFTISTGPVGGNVVALGSGEGNSGETVTVPMMLTNETAMRGLQLDITFNSAVASFLDANPTGRGAALDVAFQTVAGGRARGVLNFHTNQSLAAGTGAIANLSFRLAGPQGGQTTLALTNLVFSDPNAQPAEVTGQNGMLSVTGGPNGGPDVDIAVLKNPGRERALNVYVTVVDGSGSLPTLTVGGAAVTPTALGGGVFVATRHIAGGTNSVTIQASDTNGSGTGSDQVTISF